MEKEKTYEINIKNSKKVDLNWKVENSKCPNHVVSEGPAHDECAISMRIPGVIISKYKSCPSRVENLLGRIPPYEPTKSRKLGIR